jgi:peptidoglycan/xylan/chitin deacetylase (PgdA/CDA1 family)
MRWPWIVAALGLSAVASGDIAPRVAVSVPAPGGAAIAPAAEREPAPPIVEEPAGTEPLPPQPPPKLAEIPGTVSPPSFTDDPVLGRAERIVGHGVANKIAFTFDDGPSPLNTPAVLAALDKYNVPASFFIVTRKFNGAMLSAPAMFSRMLLARELASGHLVGSHAVHHDHLVDVSPRDLDREIDGSLEQLAREAGKPVALFRPPFGKISWAGRKRLKGLGVTEVFWSIDPRDWDAVAGDEDELRHRIAHEIWNSGGGVIILHDSKAVTARVLPGVLDDLEAANCRRLARHKPPMIPVSLHYFMQDGDTPRPVPADVEARTQAYVTALPDRCLARRKKRR